MNAARAIARPTRLATVPTIHEGDSLSGVVGRIATLYRLRRPQALTALGWPSLPGHTQSHLPRLDFDDLGAGAAAIARSLELSESHFVQLQLPGPASARGAWIYRGATPVCPQCLVERPGAHQLLWRHALVAVCLRHERTLVSHCPQCDRTPYRPDPPDPWPHHRSGQARMVACACGATAADLARLQRTARPEEVDAARKVARLALERREDEASGHIERVRRAMIATLRSPNGGGARHSVRAENDLARYAGRRTRGISPPLGSTGVAELLPAVLAAIPDTTPVQTEGGRPASGHGPDPGSVGALYLVRGQQWPDLLPAVARPNSFKAQHLPALLPLDVIAPEVADLLADLHHAYRGGDHTQAPLGVSAMRRALSVLIAACLWRQSLAAAGRQLAVAGRAAPELAAIRDGAVRLDRCTELTAAIADTASRLMAAPRVDYAARKATLPPPEPWLEAMTKHGIGRATATAWYLEHYACVEPGRYGWSPHACWQALTDHSLTELAAAAARAGYENRDATR